jgi:hypothetical protein
MGCLPISRIFSQQSFAQSARLVSVLRPKRCLPRRLSSAEAGRIIGQHKVVRTSVAYLCQIYRLLRFCSKGTLPSKRSFFA